MKRPRIFISSTIYDFKDLRSSLRYWLQDELGYDVQMSEYCNFDKDSSKNSYEACLEVIPDCEVFILLIGSRVGGMYDKKNKISITRKEYQTAYEAAKAGKVKKIITFIRQNVWDAREDRKSLKKLLSNEYDSENSNLPGYDTAYYASTILNDDAKHILSFIKEVLRNEEWRDGKKPLFNWVQQFNFFPDIVSTLETELRIKTNFKARVMEQNVRLALMNNLKWIFNKNIWDTPFNISPNFREFKPIHNKLKAHENEYILGKDTMSFSKVELTDAQRFFMQPEANIDKLGVVTFDDAISSGVFIDYDKQNGGFVESDFHKSLIDISMEINLLKDYLLYIPPEVKIDLNNAITNHDQAELEYSTRVMLAYNNIYEAIENIIDLSRYMINYMQSHDKSMNYPKLLRGITGDTRPSEDEILEILQG